jgi:hypothetical protein
MDVHFLQRNDVRPFRGNRSGRPFEIAVSRLNVVRHHAQRHFGR